MRLRLGTQINHLVKDGNLRTGSSVQLNQIIIVLGLALIAEGCELIGNPVSAQKTSGPSSSSGDQPGRVNASLQSFGTSSVHGGMVGNQNMSVAFVHSPEINQSHDTSSSRNYGSGRMQASATLDQKLHSLIWAVILAPPQSAYQQPSLTYSNRGSFARNEAPPRIVPITALNPYHGRWTLKARAMTKGELSHYNNTRGDGKVFSFDLLDCDGGEIRATCFNQVADQFYNQIEAGRIYFLPPALGW
ncbi:hypothetical protein NC653_001460 [Populus alba x Populus x berolinensis]|uniref:Uncharacterized protein n=1 Tax=Populus alba x Populus x berolinensis TaxID=444605 RepID=A0AAD6RMH6_9ROSI|nr:hypothetical protein NC653_001460 [Populus alba x Populus x berolinensis]